MRRTSRQFIRQDCWIEVINKMPIPCVDVIVWRDDEFLMGWRVIPPYRNVWALVGGRMVRGESFAQTAIRHCRKSRLRIDTPRFSGVYPVRFPSRHDVTVCMIGKWRSGAPVPTKELSNYRWFDIKELHEMHPVGGNYRKMLRDWVGAMHQNK